MALPWITTKKEKGLSWKEGIKPIEGMKPIEPIKPVDIYLQRRGIKPAVIGPPKIREEVKDTWMKRIARVILPRKLEVRLGITEPNDYDLTMQREDARISYIREKQFVDLYRKEITEAPEISKEYKEPTSFTGQLLEGMKAGYISSVKGGFGYFVESMGRQIGSPERIAWGANLGDRATIELFKKPELLEPEDLKPFFKGGLIDRRWWGRRMGQTIPYMGTTIALATAGGLMGGAPGAYVGGFGTAFALEKGNSYKRFIDEGMPSDKADTYSNVYGTIAAYIENAFGISPAKMGTQIAAKGAERIVYDSFKQYLMNEIPKLAISTLQSALGEGGEEVAQSIAENLVLKFYKTETPIFSKDLAEEFASGAAASIPFGAVNIRIPSVDIMPDVGLTIKETKDIESSINKINEQLLKVEEIEPKVEPAIEPISKELEPLAERTKTFKTVDEFEGSFVKSIATDKFKEALDYQTEEIVDEKMVRVVPFVDRFEAALKAIEIPPVILPPKWTGKVLTELSGLNLEKTLSRIDRGLDIQKNKSATLQGFYDQVTKEVVKIEPKIEPKFPKDKYQLEILEEIGKLDKLPEIDPAAFEWTPPKFTYKNPYTKVMYSALNKVSKIWDSKGPADLKHAQTQEISNLLKERGRVYDGLIKKYKEEIVKPLIKLTTKEKQKIGRMIFKGINIPEGYKAQIKDIDVKIGQLGEAIVNVDKEMIKKGLLKKDMSLLSEKTWMSNLGQYARTLYVKIEDGKTKIIPRSVLTAEGVIDRSAFKRKMTNQEWGANALAFEGKTIEEIQEYSSDELEEIGIAAKEKHGWVFQADYVLARTFQDMSKAYASRLFQKAIVENPRLFTDKAKEARRRGFVPATKVVLRAKMSEVFKKTIIENEELFNSKIEEAEKNALVLIKDLDRNFSDAFKGTILENKELLAKKVEEAEEKGFIRVADILPKGIEKDVRLGPLNYGYIHPGLQEEINTFLLGPAKDSITSMFNEVLSWWKIAKVPANPATVARNWASGTFFQSDLAGYPVWDPRNSAKYIEAINSYFSKDALYKKLRDGGQYGSDYFTVEIATDEMAEVLSKAKKSDNPMAAYSEGLFSKLGTKLKDAKQLANYYGHIDHMQRTYLALCAMKDGASTAQAVHFANKWQLDYRYVPKIIDYLRHGLPGFLYPFVSFYALMVPRIAEVLVTRPWVLIKYPIMIGIFNAVSATLLGADDDEVENAKPEYLVGKDYVTLLPTRDNEGNFQFLDMSYALPFGEPITFLDKDAVWNMMKNPGLMSALLSIFNNYDNFADRKIYNETDSAEDKRKKIGVYALRSFGPGFVPHVLNIWRAAHGEVIGFPIKRERNLAQSIARGLGVSVYSGGFNEAFWKIRNLQSEINDMQWAMKMLMENPNVSAEEKQRKMIEFQDEMRVRVEKIQEISRAMPRATTAAAPVIGEPSGALPWKD